MSMSNRVSRDLLGIKIPDDIMADMLKTAQEGRGEIRTFSTGATRDADHDKLDFEGFLCPEVLERYAVFMHGKRLQNDGQYRGSDNWQKGIPKAQYLKSAWRHFHHIWREHRRGEEVPEDDVCALMFNVMGYLHEHLKESR